MSIEITAETLIPLSVKERKAVILQQASLIDINLQIDEDLYPAYKFGKIISSVAEEYFQYKISQEQSNSVLQLKTQSELIAVQTNRFADNFISWLAEDFEKKKAIVGNYPKPRNIFELANAKLLITSNSVTRTLSTTMGRLWEEISYISPYVIVPEFEFDIKITGIDIIVFTGDKIYFTQLKTQKDTLTGSQVKRAIKELIIHENPLFAAAFNLGKTWAISQKPNISRMAGKQFWDMIQIDYSLVELHVKEMLQKIDKAFTELAAN